MYEDKTLVCRDCGAEFVFTAGEQAFYAEKGFQNEPSRCKACRDARKANGGARRDDSRPREMYDAICAECGKPTKIPFLPKNDRPVYCRCATRLAEVNPLRYRLKEHEKPDHQPGDRVFLLFRRRFCLYQQYNSPLRTLLPLPESSVYRPVFLREKITGLFLSKRSTSRALPFRVNPQGEPQNAKTRMPCPSRHPQASP